MKYKSFIAALVAMVLLLAGCSQKRADISREEIVTAYEAAGYIVSTDVYDEKLDYGQIAYVQADHPDGDYIYFLFFETEEAAEKYKRQFYHPVTMGLFSVLFGEPSWQCWEVYGCIVAQYDVPEYMKPFEGIMKNP